MKKITLYFLSIFLGYNTLTAQIDSTQTSPEVITWNIDSVKNRSLPRVIKFLELGVSANAYKGELGNYEKWASSFHIALRWNQRRNVNGRLALSMGTVIGDDPTFVPSSNSENIEVNTFFKANVLTVHYELQLNLINRENYKLYFSQGLGLFRFASENENEESLQDLQSTRANNETYNIINPIFPTGLGMSYYFKNGYSFGLQASFLNHFTDYLDNISLLGDSEQNDNTLMIRFHLAVPLKKTNPSKIPQKYKIVSPRDVFDIYE